MAVRADEPVDQGQLLVVIEAMKMENEIVAPRAGIVRNLVVTVGAGVTSGQLLCAIEEAIEEPDTGHAEPLRE